MSLFLRRLRLLVVLLSFLGFLALELTMLVFVVLGLSKYSGGVWLYLALPLVLVSLVAGLKVHLSLFRHLRA